MANSAHGRAEREDLLIPVIQFMLPDGREREQSVRRPAEIAEKAYGLLAKGYRFEAEILTTGDVHLTLSDPAEEIDLFSELAPNGPEVLTAFDRLVTRAEEEL